MTVLAAEIPAACAAACEVTGEPWQHHPSAICLRAIPRLHHRLTALGMPAAATDLETGMHHWTRLVKLALGLRTPDIPPAGTKPLITGGPTRRAVCHRLASWHLRSSRRFAGQHRRLGGAPGCSERLAPGFVVEYLIDGTRSRIVRFFHDVVAACPRGQSTPQIRERHGRLSRGTSGVQPPEGPRPDTVDPMRTATGIRCRSNASCPP